MSEEEDIQERLTEFLGRLEGTESRIRTTLTEIAEIIERAQKQLKEFEEMGEKTEAMLIELEAKRRARAYIA